MDPCHLDHGLTRLRRVLVVLAQAAIAPQPGQGPFHHPTALQRDEPPREADSLLCVLPAQAGATVSGSWRCPGQSLRRADGTKLTHRPSDEGEAAKYRFRRKKGTNCQLTVLRYDKPPRFPP